MTTLENNEWRKITRENLSSDIYAYGKGRVFERWIDTVGGVARDNGHNAGDLIEDPAGVIESVLRDEVFVERDLVIDDANVDPDFAETPDLRSSVDDYYNNAIYYNATTGNKTYISDYAGGTKTLSLGATDTGQADGDKFFLTNVQGDSKIVIATFDKVGNTTDGLRKDWKFGRSLYSAEQGQSILEQLCFESHCILFNTYSGYKLVALDEEEASVDTWTVPLKRITERELVNVRLTPLADIYTDYRLKYHYDYGSGTHKKEFFVNKSSVSSNAAILSVGDSGTPGEGYYCGLAEQHYKVKKYFEYSADWIYDDDTAEYLLQKLIKWLTKQYAIVTWTGELKTYIKYELGDQVIINYSNMIPDALNNTSRFMIFDKTIDPLSPNVTFQLIEMGAGLSGYGFLYGGKYGIGL